MRKNREGRRAAKNYQTSPHFPQLLRSESVAARRLYHGILDETWCGT